MTISGTLTVEIIRDKQIPMSPLERTVGFRFSEDIYDHLELVDQILLDLMIEGWEQQDIARLFCVHKSWISIRLRRIRAYLATTELYRIVALRNELKNGEQY
jgi:hypothetical protein